MFAAIDFESADRQRDNACSVGVSLVENGRIAESDHRLTRPTRNEFVFTYIHGLTWRMFETDRRFLKFDRSCGISLKVRTSLSREMHLLTEMFV